MSLLYLLGVGAVGYGLGKLIRHEEKRIGLGQARGRARLKELLCGTGDAYSDDWTQVERDSGFLRDTIKGFIEGEGLAPSEGEEVIQEAIKDCPNFRALWGWLPSEPLYPPARSRPSGLIRFRPEPSDSPREDVPTVRTERRPGPRPGPTRPVPELPGAFPRVATGPTAPGAVVIRPRPPTAPVPIRTTPLTAASSQELERMRRPQAPPAGPPARPPVATGGVKRCHQCSPSGEVVNLSSDQLARRQQQGEVCTPVDQARCRAPEIRRTSPPGTAPLQTDTGFSEAYKRGQELVAQSIATPTTGRHPGTCPPGETWNALTGRCEKDVATGGPTSCKPGEFWDGTKCRGAVDFSRVPAGVPLGPTAAPATATTPALSPTSAVTPSAGIPAGPAMGPAVASLGARQIRRQQVFLG